MSRGTGGLLQFVVGRHHVAVPDVPDISLQFSAQRTVIPESILSAIDFGVLEDESASLAQRDDLVHRAAHRG